MQPTRYIEESLGVLAETDVDVYGKIYEHFFRGNPAAETLMSHMDDLTRGRMLEEVTRLLLVDDLGSESEYLDFEMNNHQLAYSVEAAMYLELLEAFHLVVKDIAGDQWRVEFEKSWTGRINELTRLLLDRVPS